jgi:23S rRNA-/tRNA-specific pseudouridylate synthase
MENKIIIDELNMGKRLDQFLQEKLPEFSRAHIQNAISKGEIKLIRKEKILENNREKWRKIIKKWRKN